MAEESGSFDPNIHVPGHWRCARCSFLLVQRNLNAIDGTVTARDQAGDHCPNDGAPLWRVTWQDHAAEAWCEIERLVDERQELRAAALDFVSQVQALVLSRDDTLLAFNLDKLDRLLWLCDPQRPRKTSGCER